MLRTNLIQSALVAEDGDMSIEARTSCTDSILAEDALELHMSMERRHARHGAYRQECVHAGRLVERMRRGSEMDGDARARVNEEDEGAKGEDPVGGGF